MVMPLTPDLSLRGVIADEKLRFVFVRAPKTLSDGIIAHNCDPVSGMLFGEALLCALLNVPLMAEDQRTTLRWGYDGAVGKIICEADFTGGVRGLPQHPSLHDVANEDALFGESGTISTVLSDLKTGAILNSGTTPTGMMDIVNDFAFLHCLSDQVETEAITRIGFRPDPAAPVAYAAALMLQAMPDADLKRFETLRTALQTQAVRDTLFAPDTDPKTAVVSAIQAIGCQGDVEIHEGAAPSYSCPCERGRMIQSVRTLARSEIEHIFDNRDEIELVCRFCNKRYKLKKSEC